MISSHHLLKDLPGKARFHSALLSTYCIDFAFLESRMIPMLRARGIRNIALIADAHMVEQALADAAETARQSTKLYTLSTFLCAGAFHPKLHFYCGDSAVAVVVGSGNISSGGMGKNAEVCTTLYADSDDQSQLPLILKAWAYLRHSCGEFAGMSAQQVKWMERHCDLLKGADTNGALHTRGFIEVSKGLFADFFTSEGTSLWLKLQTLFPVPKMVRTITVAAPYFDEGGIFLRQLLRYFPSAKLRVLLQPELALLPKNIGSHDRLQFFDWDNCTAASILDYSRSHLKRFLHAKLLCFESANGNVLITGSANPTNRAFLESDKGNKEAVLVLRSNTIKWTDILGIADAGSAIKLPRTKQQQQERSDSQTGLMSHKIIAADATNSRCVIYLEREIVAGLELRCAFFDAEGRDVYITGVLQGACTQFIFNIGLSDKLKRVIRVCLIDGKNAQHSNSVLINDSQALHNLDPDPANRRIQDLMAKMRSGDYSELDLYECYDILMAERDTSTNRKNSRRQKTGTDDENDGMSSQEAFRTLEERRRATGGEEDAPVKLLDAYLNGIGSAIEAANADDIDDEEDGDISTGKKRKKKPIKQKEFKSEREFEKHRERITRFYQRYTGGLLEQTSIVAYSLESKDYAAFVLVCSHLIKIAGRSFTIKQEDRVAEDILLPLQGPVHAYASFYSIAINLAGKFLRYLKGSNGDTLYDTDYANEQLANLKALCSGELLHLIQMIKEQHLGADIQKAEKWCYLLTLNLMHVFELETESVVPRMQSSAKLFDKSKHIGQKDFSQYYYNINSDYQQLRGLNSGEYSQKHCIHYTDDLGFTRIERFIPLTTLPKALKVVSIGVTFNEDDFYVNELYSLTAQKWLLGK